MESIVRVAVLRRAATAAPSSFVYLDRPEDKRAIVAQRASKRPGDLLPVESAAFRHDGVRRLQGVAAMKQRETPVSRVRAGARDDVDGRGPAPAELRGKSVRDDLELLHGVDRKVLEHAADDFVGVVHAIDAHVAAASKLSRRRDLDDPRLGGIEVRRRGVAGNQERQLQIVPAVQRQRLDRRLLDDAGDLALDGADRRRRGRDGDGLRDRRHPQRQHDLGRRSDVDDNVGKEEDGKPAPLRSNRVDAGPQVRNDVAAVGRGRRGASEARVLLRRRDRDVGHAAFLRVEGQTADRALRDLRRRGRDPEAQG